MYSSDEERMTPCIKAQISTIQRAFVNGGETFYENLRVKVLDLISKAKRRFSQRKAG